MPNELENNRPVEIDNPEELFDRRQIFHTEKSTIISSNHLTHFTSQFNTLVKIIEEGFKPSFCNESPIYQKEYEELTALYGLLDIEIPNIEDVRIPMVCFSDIPLKSSIQQRRKYGWYGIALKKEWAMAKWITPITYVAENTKNHSLLFSINSLVNNAIGFHRSDRCQTEDNPYLINLQNNVLKYMSYVKPYFDSTHYVKYYDEREWRYVPDDVDEEDLGNSDRYLKFDHQDIYQIIVTTSDERRQIRKLFRMKFQKEIKQITIRHKKNRG